MDIINLIIDNKPVVVKKGTTILEAASGIGVHIPTLCHMKLDDLNIENKPGGCRICVVEVDGRRNLTPACCTDVNEGMNVSTHSVRAINCLLYTSDAADDLLCVD